MPTPKTASYTPGPWKYQHEFDDEPTFVVDAEGNPFVSVEPPNGEANARLIAAAPELLEALQATVDALERGKTITADEQWGIMARAEAAIKKATGG